MKKSFNFLSKFDTRNKGNSLKSGFLSTLQMGLYIKAKNILMLGIFVFVIFMVLSSCNTKSHYLRGNLHTHTLWSDGDDFPESVTKWYKDNGYDFIALTDHNILPEGERWRRVPINHPALLKYTEKYGYDWIEMRNDEKEQGFHQVRLKTLEEFRSKYEMPGKFLIIQGNEITCPHAVHMTTFQQYEVIPPSTGTPDDREKMITEIVGRIEEYNSRTGCNTLPVLAHPNFRWAITAEMILNNPSLRFFEVYNGHPQVNNTGDDYRASSERIWDIVLANRLKNEKGEVIYGLATDDAHNYHGGDAGPGKGWVMVNSKKLSTESLFDAMNKGDFYSTTGVTIKRILVRGKNIKVKIEPQEGVKYLTEFIGTLKGFNPTSIPTVDSIGVEIPNTTRNYSEHIGKVIASREDYNPSYTFSGNELYVRVNIISNADHIDPNTGNILGKQQAWIQPILPPLQRKKQDIK